MRGEGLEVCWGGLLGGGWLPSLGLGVSRDGVSVTPLAPNCSLFLHRASWVFLVCLATLDARVPR